MRDVRYHVVLAALLVIILVSAAFAALKQDRIVVTGPGGGKPGIVTSAPIEYREPQALITTGRTLSPGGGDFSGRIYRVAGTGAVTITLPTPTTQLAGVVYTFINDSDNNLTISCTGAIAGDNATAAAINRNSATLSTANRKRGHVLRVVCTGSYWIVQALTPNCSITWA